MKKAFKLRKVPGFKGVAFLYRLDPPLPARALPGRLRREQVSNEYVISSAVVVAYGPETYLFPADEEGRVVSWVELPGSQKGTLDNDAPLIELGYEIHAGELPTGGQS